MAAGPKMTYVLVSLGNTLRGDDGVAHAVADAIHDETGGAVPVFKRTALDIGDIPLLRVYDPEVFFVVDACRMPDAERGAVLLSERAMGEEPGLLRHGLQPRQYREMATALGLRAELCMVLVAGERFAHDAHVSAFSRRNAREAATIILEVIHGKRWNDDKGFPITRERDHFLTR